MLHVLPSRNCKPLFHSFRKLIGKWTIKDGLNDTNICVVFLLIRVSVMGNNFTYNSSEFGKGDVYTTIRTYLRPGKTHFDECLLMLKMLPNTYCLLSLTFSRWSSHILNYIFWNYTFFSYQFFTLCLPWNFSIGVGREVSTPSSTE